MTRLMFIAAAAVLPAQAWAQGWGWQLQIQYLPGSGGVVSPEHPEATVRLLAWFQGSHNMHPIAFLGGDGDVLADEGMWTDARLLDVHVPPTPPPSGTSAGTIVGDRVELFILGQIHYPPAIQANRDNPIALWEGTWTTGDFTPRDVGIRTANTDRYNWYYTGPTPWFPAEHGSASVAVVPTPGAAAALALAGAMSGRRGRRGADAGEEGGRC
jgi:hypothetical protein